ncbi:hypothetical protein EV122DRAFT_178486, partial [Schizophyllum commune]
LGDLPVHPALVLYTSRVDPILCYGCEVGVALTHNAIISLEGTQINFWRRIQGLPQKSRCITVDSKTGLLPIQQCWLIIALRFFKRL